MNKFIPVFRVLVITSTVIFILTMISIQCIYICSQEQWNIFLQHCKSTSCSNGTHWFCYQWNKICELSQYLELFLYKEMLIFKSREEERDLTQSYGRAPITTENSTSNWQHKRATKTSITQRFRTELDFKNSPKLFCTPWKVNGFRKLVKLQGQCQKVTNFYIMWKFWKHWTNTHAQYDSNIINGFKDIDKVMVFVHTHTRTLTLGL